VHENSIQEMHREHVVVADDVYVVGLEASPRSKGSEVRNDFDVGSWLPSRRNMVCQVVWVLRVVPNSGLELIRECFF
jgi:hypothetical protein